MKRHSSNAFVAALFAGALTIASTQAQAQFTGAYSQNFDSALGTTGTTLPPGFLSMVIAGANSTYTAASPITAAGVASATADTQTTIIWNAGAKDTDSGSQSFNIGCWDGTSDRALGTDPTGTGAQVIQLSLTNNTGGVLHGVTFSYDCKCLTNGSAGTEQTELPGYCFFYSTTGTNSAANWTEVGVAGAVAGATNASGVPIANGLCLPNFTQGTTMSSGLVSITFATPLTNNGVMYFRWADDNNEASSPDQMIAIDNISVVSSTPAGPAISITSPVSGSSVLAGTVTVQSSVTDLAGSVTNVSYFSGATFLGQAITAPFSFTWPNVAGGTYVLTALAIDNKGLTATSSVVNVTVTNPAVAAFTGSYTQNFDAALAGSATAIPAGFEAMYIAGSHSDYLAANAEGPAAIASAIAGTQSLSIWNAGAANTDSETGLFNVGDWDSQSDRAMGTDPTGNAATIIQLALTNSTGGNLSGVTFSYDCKCLTNGSVGTEESELPGYSFFYSLTGSTNAADWIEVGVAGNVAGATNASGVPIANGLCLPNFTQGTTTSSGPVNITFTTPLPGNGIMYFRWCDDNNVSNSPDQMLAIDNVNIASDNPVGPTVSFTQPFSGENFIPGASNIVLAVNASDIGSTITNVTFYTSSSAVASVSAAPYTYIIPAAYVGTLVPQGNYALSAVATDAAGLSATSSVVNITIAYVPPTVSLTSPVSGSSYPAAISIPLSASASSADGTVTNVAFYQGTTLLANSTTAPFSFTWANAVAGSYNLTARATDNRGLSVTSSVVAITVTNGFGVSVTSPANNTSFTPGSSVTITANASEAGGSITNVAFYSGSALLGNAPTAPYSFNWLNVSAGNYALAAVATDANGLTATSSVVNISVATVHVPPSVSLTNPVNNAVLDVATGLVISATASSTSGTVTNVAFYQNTFLLGKVTAAPFTFNWTNALTGDYTLTAVATDNTGASSTSSVVNVVATNSIEIATIQQIKTVFIIPLENHDFVQSSPESSPEQLQGNPACPYFNSLITPGNSNSVQTAYATHYYSAAINGEHPSEPNYLWSEAGTDFGIRTDNDPSTSSGNIFSNVLHLAGQLTTAGIPWRSYQEDIQYSSSELVSASGSGASVNPYNGTTEYYYAVKHNPMAFFTDTQNKNVYPMTNFWTDLTNNNIGRYNWITPDQYNEMHSSLPSGYTYNGVAYSGDQAAIAEGDNALSIIVPKIMASQAYKDHGVIIIWTDETESTDDTNTTLPYVIVSSLAKGNAYASALPYSHSSDLKTMDELFHLAYQTNAIPGYLDSQNTGTNNVNGKSAAIYDLSDFFVSATATTLASSENPSTYKDNVTFTAAVAGSGTPGGTVQFETNGIAWGTPMVLANGIASLSTATLPVGTNVITVNYSGDSFNQASTYSLTQVVTNKSIVAGPAFYSRAANVSLLIKISDLLTNVVNPNGYTIALIGAGANGQNMRSTNGATLFNNGTYMLYTNSVMPNVNDGFNYTVSDGQGDTNQGTVSIILNNNIFGQSNVKLTISNSSVTANFFGVPGFRYAVQRSTNLTAGEGWISISTNTAPADGLMQVTDGFQDLGIPVPPVPTSVYYRLQYNP